MALTLELDIDIDMYGTPDDVQALAGLFNEMYKTGYSLPGTPSSTDASEKTMKDLLVSINCFVAEDLKHPDPHRITFFDDDAEVVDWGNGRWACNITVHCDQVPLGDIESLSVRYPSVDFQCEAMLYDTKLGPGPVLDALARVTALATCRNQVWK